MEELVGESINLSSDPRGRELDLDLDGTTARYDRENTENTAESVQHSPAPPHRAGLQVDGADQCANPNPPTSAGLQEVSSQEQSDGGWRGRPDSEGADGDPGERRAKLPILIACLLTPADAADPTARAAAAATTTTTPPPLDAWWCCACTASLTVHHHHHR